MAKERDISSLSEEEYDILIRKILGRFNTPVSERTLVEKKILRKYNRLVKGEKELRVGPSGKSIYVDGKLLVRNEEVAKAINSISKESKNPGIRKLTERIQSRFAGCSRKKVIAKKLEDKSLKVFIYSLSTLEIFHDLLNNGVPCLRVVLRHLWLPCDTRGQLATLGDDFCDICGQIATRSLRNL